MHEVSINDAGTMLKELIDEVAFGEEVVIKKEDGKVFQIIPVEKENPRPKFGSAKGQIQISDDFDEPLEDFKEYAS